MQPRLLAFGTAFTRATLVARSFSSTTTARFAPFVCRSCQRKFSTSPTLRLFGRSSKNPLEKDRKYKSRLLIYDAGEARTSWVSFWKATALLQFGITLVFGVPPLWKNENQPDPYVRRLQAVLVGILGTVPTLTLAYLTAPFVHQIFLKIPETARRSRQDLMRFARTLSTNPTATANTRLEFVTLRIFPFRKNTTALLHELRALPPRKFRLANIELRLAQPEKSFFKRVLEVLNEPRFKFHVKEGRRYTMKTGVPGVWEEVANRIKEQTVEEERAGKGKGEKKMVQAYRPVRPAVATVKRVTTRPVVR
ncbi:hypothetical protein BDW02DRAFT_76004 [Decorospora gaudefroyi]|uniref:Uncharacterized protein n=1 Tax=Decorospora gaudefroyi TaxID=184978 RepID=A0A6A5K4D6_9PLEO|nr:hypothetical protein BDW02DRAFT_76004 [Decorospora gaudefroyi]